VKRDLRVGNVRAEAVDQLAGYVAHRGGDPGAALRRRPHRRRGVAAVSPDPTR
jgi:hypothetical protein